MASQNLALFKSTLQFDSDTFLGASDLLSKRLSRLQKDFKNLGATLDKVSQTRPLVLAPAIDQNTESAGRFRQMLSGLKSDQDQFHDQVGALNDSMVNGAIPSASRYENQLGALSNRFTEVKENSRGLNDITRAVGTAFSGAAIEGKNLGDVVKNLGQKILQVFSKSVVTDPLQSSLQQAISGFSFSNLFSGGPAATGPLFGPGFAEGGRPPVGVPSLVGELGPELFIPHSTGTIIPNKDLGNFGGGTHINIDLRGSNGSQEIFQTVQKAIKTAAPAIINQAVVTVKDGRQRDPSFFSR